MSVEKAVLRLGAIGDLMEERKILVFQLQDTLIKLYENEKKLAPLINQPIREPWKIMQDLTDMEKREKVLTNA